MKEGVLLYITQKKACSEQQMERFIEQNRLGGVPIVVAGLSEKTLNFYDAYKELGRQGVDIVECFTARIDESGELELLSSNITLPAGIDLLKFCTPEELGLGTDADDKSESPG